MNTVVYYPHFYPSARWLRLSALCWDKIYTMTLPDSPKDPVVEELDGALGGILEQARPWGGISPSSLDSFKSWVMLRGEQLEAQPLVLDETLVALFPGKDPGGKVLGFLLNKGLAKRQERPVDVQIPEWEINTWNSDRHLESVRFMHEVPEPVFDDSIYPGAKRVSDKAVADYWKYKELIEQIKLTRRRGFDDPQARRRLSLEAEQIRKRNLITVTDYEPEILLPRDIALHFLSICAYHEATAEKRDIVTDGQQFTDAVLSSVPALRGEVAFTTLEAYVPADLAAIGPERIAEFRSQLSPQRLKYQKAIQDLVAEFDDVASEGTLDTLKHQLVEIAKTNIDETQRTYRKARVEIAAQTLGVALTPPAMATVAASALGIGLIAPAGLAAALSLFLGSKIIEWNQARRTKRDAPWSYVLAAGKL